jgi:hypothetical protein
MQRYNVTVPKKYTKDGEEKTSWNRVGTLVKFEAKDGKPESFILELNMYPDTKFAVFADEPKTGTTPTPSTDDLETPF